MKFLLTSLLVALVCSGSVAMAKGKKKKDVASASAKECSAQARQQGKCGSKGSRAPASVSEASAASVRRETVERHYSPTAGDHTDK